MKYLLVSAAALLLFAGPAAAQKPDPAEVAKIAGEIQADKAKLKIFCDMVDLENQAYEAEEKKDDKKAEELGKKAADLSKQLGDGYAKVVAGGEQFTEESKEAEAYFKGLEPLYQACDKD